MIMLYPSKCNSKKQLLAKPYEPSNETNHSINQKKDQKTKNEIKLNVYS